ncbi:MAG: polyhydroxyalkanoic acid system family protein [Bdellovibrionales bacterium]
MAKIKFEYETEQASAETFNKIKDLIDNNKDLQQLDKNYTATYDEQNLSANAKGKQFEANLQVKEQGEGSVIHFEIKVGLMLSAFKGVIEEKMKKKLGKLLA